MIWVFYLCLKHVENLKADANMTFELVPVITFFTFFPIVYGMFLRLPKLILEIMDKKQWTFDWIKVVAVGIPALYVTILPFLLYTNTVSNNFFLAKEIMHIGNFEMASLVFGMIFGYVLMDSLKK